MTRPGCQTMARAVLRCPVVEVAAAGAAGVRRVVGAGRPAILRGLVDGEAVASILRCVAAAGRAPALAPRRGENTVSGERNRWDESPPFEAAALLLGGGRARGQARLDVPAGIVGAVEARARVAVDGRESAVFVTSAGLRTPLHSDPSHSLLVHASGSKRFVLVAPEQSDADRAALENLLSLRSTSGTLADLYYNGPAPSTGARHAAALAAVDVVVGDLEAAGDALYIPKRWLHDVESASATVSLAARLLPPPPRRRRRRRR